MLNILYFFIKQVVYLLIYLTVCTVLFHMHGARGKFGRSCPGTVYD